MKAQAIERSFINKYFNKLVYYDLKVKRVLEQRLSGALCKTVICFDSQFEFEVFKVINAQFPLEHINFHFKLELKPKTQYSAPINYLVDFRVRTPNDFLYIEAKGLMTKEASLKIKLLEILKPEIRNNLIIVSEKKQHYFGKHYPPSVDIASLGKFLKEFYGKHRRH